MVRDEAQWYMNVWYRYEKNGLVHHHKVKRGVTRFKDGRETTLEVP